MGEADSRSAFCPNGSDAGRAPEGLAIIEGVRAAARKLFAAPIALPVLEWRDCLECPSGYRRANPALKLA